VGAVRSQWNLSEACSVLEAMRRFSPLVVTLLALSAGSGGQSSVESTVTAYLNSTYGSGTANSASCVEDHTLKVQGKTATVYRCTSHGGQQDGIEVCVAFQGRRMLGEKQRSTVPMSKLLCANQG
jgi:hypothetical protein